MPSLSLCWQMEQQTMQFKELDIQIKWDKYRNTETNNKAKNTNTNAGSSLARLGWRRIRRSLLLTFPSSPSASTMSVSSSSSSSSSYFSSSSSSLCLWSWSDVPLDCVRDRLESKFDDESWEDWEVDGRSAITIIIILIVISIVILVINMISMLPWKESTTRIPNSFCSPSHGDISGTESGIMVSKRP